VPLPDVRGREQILKVHMRKVPTGDDVVASVIARGTPGFSGADLANLVNEAALFAARANKRLVDMEDMEKAKDKIMMGTERRSMVMSEDEKKLTAYHESGHAIVGRSVPEHDPVHKVSIIPRGRARRDAVPAGGGPLQLQQAAPGEPDLQPVRRSHRRGADLRARMVTTGASNDIQRATDIARNMVTKWGLSDKLGPLTYSEDEQEVFLGHSVTQHKQVSDETAHLIDKEVRSLHRPQLRACQDHPRGAHGQAACDGDALIKYETIDADQIGDIMEGRDPRPPRTGTKAAVRRDVMCRRRRHPPGRFRRPRRATSPDSYQRRRCGVRCQRRVGKGRRSPYRRPFAFAGP
jgi:cell division protease FtsH